MKNQYQVEIFKQDHFGRGIAKIDEKLVFVEKALPKEICTIQIINEKKDYMIGNIIEIKTSSEERKSAECPYYDICGGCHIMHQKYQKQLAFKEMKVKELIWKFTGNSVKIKPICYDEDFYYRNKVIFHGQNQQLGFYQEKTNKIINISTCMITNKKINEILKKIKKYLDNTKEEIIDEVMFRINSKQEVMISIKGNINEEFLKSLDCHTIYLNDHLITGKGYLVEDIFDFQFHIYPTSFFQVNDKVMRKMYERVIEFYQDKNYQTVLDLYCGTGTMGMLISQYVKEVIGIEVEKSSVDAAVECSRYNHIHNISFKQGKVEDHIDQFQAIDSMIVDPPRRGLDNHTIQSILTILPKTIIYISCDPATLARDLKLLSEKYEILEIQPFDMFPNTYHIECVSVLNLKR